MSPGEEGGYWKKGKEREGGVLAEKMH